jgi:hypothetical protein
VRSEQLEGQIGEALEASSGVAYAASGTGGGMVAPPPHVHSGESTRCWRWPPLCFGLLS